jgi:topoisomerase IA-like protein
MVRRLDSCLNSAREWEGGEAHMAMKKAAAKKTTAKKTTAKKTAKKGK